MKFFLLALLVIPLNASEVSKIFKEKKLIGVHVFPHVVHRQKEDSIFGKSNPKIAPGSGKKVAAIFDRGDLDVIQKSLSEGKAPKKNKIKNNSQEYRIIFLFEGSTFFESYLVLDGSKAYIHIYEELGQSRDFLSIELSPKSRGVLANDLVKLAAF